MEPQWATKKGVPVWEPILSPGVPLTHQIIFLTVHRAVDAVESLAAQSSPWKQQSREGLEPKLVPRNRASRFLLSTVVSCI